MEKIIILLTIFLALNVKANSDWGREVCLSSGGQVSEIQLQRSAVTKIEICSLGQALIELNTLDYSRMNPYGGPEANRAYRNTRDYDFGSCIRNFGKNLRGQDTKTNRIYNICEFSDRSWIGTDTLTNGFTSPWNHQLNQVLGIY